MRPTVRIQQRALAEVDQREWMILVDSMILLLLLVKFSVVVYSGSGEPQILPGSVTNHRISGGRKISVPHRKQRRVGLTRPQ